MKRRDFVKKSAALAATVVASPLAVANVAESSSVAELSQENVREGHIVEMEISVSDDLHDALRGIQHRFYRTHPDGNFSVQDLEEYEREMMLRLGFPETLNYQFVRFGIRPNILKVGAIWGPMPEINKFLEKAKAGFNGLTLVSIKDTF